MNQSYCSKPFSHIYSDSSGAFKLCCRSDRKNNPLSKYNSNRDLPFDVFFSPEMEEVRDKMINGEKLDTCKWCYKMEEMGAKSDRLYKGHEQMFEPGNVTLKLRIFGNSCNLACYMCHPYNSSTRTREMKQMEMNAKEFYMSDVSFDAGIKKSFYERLIQNILDHIHYVGNIHITGGEPFLLPKHYDFIERIPEKNARNITVSYDTNLTTLEYKGKSVLDTLQKFGNVDFSVSCDHYDEKLAYIRYPIDVNQFYRNIEHVQKHYNYISQVQPTVSMLNIEDLDDILPFYEKNFGIKNDGYRGLVTGKLLSVKNHPRRLELLEKYTDYEMDPEGLIEAELRKEDGSPIFWNKSIEYLERLDAHRGKNYLDLWPHYKRVSLNHD